MRSGGRIAIVIRVPERPAAIRSAVSIGVIHVDVDDVPGKRIKQSEPLDVARAQNCSTAPLTKSY